MPIVAGRIPDLNAIGPKMVPNLMAWHKADRFTAAGQITGWTDESGNGFSPVALVGADNPDVVLNKLNGLPGVVFNGTNDWLQYTGALPTTGVDNFTQILLAASSPQGTCVPVYIGVGANNGYGIALSCNPTPAKVGWLRGGIAWHAGTENFATQPRVLVARRAAGTLKLYKSGGGSVLTTTAAPNTPGSMFSIGGHEKIDASLAPLTVYESMVYTRGLSDEEIDALAHYLAKKWAVPWTPIAGPPQVGTVRFLFNGDSQHDQGMAYDAGMTSWTDNSGNNFDVTASLGATAQPILRKGICNGYDAVDFDGVNDRLDLASVQISPGGTFTWFMVVKFDTVAGQQIFLDADPSAGTRVAQIMRNLDGTFGTVKTAGTVVTDNAPGVMVADTWYICEVVWSLTGAEAHLNGLGNGASTIASPVSTATQFSIGARGGAAAANMFNGQIAYIVGYEGTLNTADRRTVRTWLSKRFGITVS